MSRHTRTDLLIEVNDAILEKLTIIEMKDLIGGMYKKIELVYDVLFVLENTEGFKEIAKKLREALET